MKRAIALLAAALALAACGNDAANTPPASAPVDMAAWDNDPAFHTSGNPARLEDWGQFRIEGERLVLAQGVTPYALNTALFSDYALKLRTVWLPDGAQPAQWHDDETFDFPVGTVITKTFYYPRTAGSFDAVALELDPNAHF